MKKRLASLTVILLVLMAFAGPSASLADEVTQNFDTWTPGTSSSGQWSVSNGCAIFSNSVAAFYTSKPNSLRFYAASTNASLLLPVITNGVGMLALNVRGTVTTNFLVQQSDDLSNWTNIASIALTSTNTFTVRSATLNIYGNNYLRLFLPGTPSSTIYVDDLSISNAPAQVAVQSSSALTTLGASDIFANDPVNVTVVYTPYGMPSNIQMTLYYRYESGASNSISMTTNGALSFITATPITGQPAGRVYYYIKTSFQGPSALSPTNYPAEGFANPLSYLVNERPNSLNVSMALTGGVASAMSLVSHYQWESFTSFTNASFSFQFQGLSNTTTRYWGDTNQSTVAPPIPSVADLNGSAIQVSPSTNQGQLFVRFEELSSGYVVKEAQYEVFDAWTTGDIGDYTNNNWILKNGMTSAQVDRKLRGSYAILESNTASWIRSAYLPKGIGEISFWYRNYNTNGSPAAGAYIEKSQTGGTNDIEWVRVDTINSISTASYLRKTVVLSDRNYNYIRIRNSTNYPNARLCLDEVLVGQPGAGVIFSAVTNAPALPAASNTVSISAVITPVGAATNLSAKVWYRTGSTGVWTFATMTNAGNNFSVALPAGKGDKTGGAGTVQYYLECGFTGYESTNTSPFFYPAATSNAALSYIVQSAKLQASNATAEPAQPVLNSTTRLRVDMTPQDGASNVSVTAYYRLNGSGGYTALPMTLLSGYTYQTASSVPTQMVEGVLLEYYFTATFAGPDANTPTNYPDSAPSSVFSTTFKIATQNSSMAVTGSLSSAMSVIAGFTWEALIPYTGTTFSIRYQAVSNGITRLWGDANQSTFVPPFTLIAETNAATIQVNPSTNNAHLVLRFLETTREYSVKQAAVHVFDGWTLASPGNDTNNNWIVQNGFTAANPELQLRNKFLVLESNSTSWIRSPYLPAGVGEISFWYRHYNPSGLPATAAYVEKSSTGGTNDIEWTRLTTITNLSASEYTRFSIVQADRNFFFVRVRNATNYPNARLCLDEMLVAQPGAGVMYTNAIITPSDPSSTNPVTVACTIISYGNAYNLTGKVWYRTGSTGVWTSIPMNRVGSTYTTDSPIPAGKGDKPGGSGTVQYYIECSYAGYDSALSSPGYYPTLGRVSPLSFSVRPATVTASDAITEPSPPLINSAARLRVNILPEAGASNVTSTAYYRIGGTGTYQTLSMSLLTNSTYQTTGAMPIQTVPGTPLEYYFSIAFAGPEALPTNYPANATSTVFSTVFHTPTWTSSYSAVTVTGDVARGMTLMADKSWRGILTLTNNIANARFRFAGTGSGSPVWKELNQSVIELPLYGTAETSGSDLLMTGTVSGSLLFQFNETNLQYTVQKAAYSDTTPWPTNYGVSTNSDGWVLAGRPNRTNDPDDILRVFEDSYLVLEGGSSTNCFLRSPRMTNGIGEVSFFYRNWNTNGSRPVKFEVQASALSTGPWTTIQTVSNVLSVDYRFFYTVLSDYRSNSYIRILNTSPAQTDRLCLDETVVSEGGAFVSLTNVTRNPTAPTIMDEVEVSVTATPLSGATNLTPVLWYKATTNAGAYYESVNMTNVSDSLYRAVIPRGPIGSMFYYVACGYSGLFDFTSPTYSPLANSAAPLTYTNADGGLFEGFETWPYWITTTSFTNDAYQGWQVYNSYCRGDGIYSAVAGSTNRAIWFTYKTFNNPNDSLLITPVITNLYGYVHLTFYARNSNNNTNDLGVYWTYNANPSTNYADTSMWTPETDFRIPSTNWTFYKVDFTNNLFRIMIRKTDGNSYLGIDRVEIAQRSSMIIFSNLVLNPGYPGTNEAVNVSCEIDTLRPGMTAFNFQPSLYYRKGQVGSFLGPIAMNRTTGSHRFTTASPIPGNIAVWDTNACFYISCKYDGYYHVTNLNNSPMTYPSNNPTGDPFTYMPRIKASDYSVVNFAGTLGTVTMDLLDNYTWQGIFRVNSTFSGLTFNFDGHDNFTGLGFSPAVSNWGQPSDQWKTNMPLADLATPDQMASIVTADPLLGQYVTRLNERTHEFSLRSCSAQQFDNWSSTSNYMLSGNSESDIITMDFNDWPTNSVRTQFDNFGSWTNPYTGFQYISYYTNRWYGGSQGWGIYDAQLTNNTGAANTPGVILSPDIQFSPYKQGRIALNGQQFINPLEGIGTVTFWFRAVHNNVWDPTNNVWSPTNPTPVSFSVNLSSNGLHENPYAWESIAVVSNIVNTSTSSFTMVVNTSAYRSVIIAHIEGASKMMLDNVSVSDFNATYFATNNWSGSEVWMQPKSGYTQVSTNGYNMALEFNGRRFNTNAYLQTPTMTNGVGFFEFYYKSATNTQPVGFDINYYKGTPPYESVETLVSVMNATNSTYLQYSLTLMTNAAGYIRIIPTSTNRLFIDDVRITGIPPNNSWEANNARIANEDGRRFRGSAVYLNSNGVSEINKAYCNTQEWPYVRTPVLTGGIGEVSFWYRNWEVTASPKPALLRVQKSISGLTGNANWTDFAVISNIVNKEFLYFQTNLYDNTYQYVRIINDTNQPNKARVILDDIMVAQPMAADCKLTNLRISPEAPVYTNDVHVYVDLNDLFLYPSNFMFEALYSVGTNYGNWATTNSQPMIMVSSNPSNRTWTYRTESAIPRQASDRFVMYQVRGAFDGLNAAGNTSPKTNKQFATPSFYYPLDFGTNTPYYIVFGAATNAVWINEIDPGNNIYDPPTHAYDFVEICGGRDIDIGNWKLVFFSPSDPPQKVATYSIPLNTLLPNNTNGFGFYVIGKNTLAIPPNQSLTNNILYPGGVTLQRPAGMYSSPIAYANSDTEVVPLLERGFHYIGADDADWADSMPLSLSLTGSGSTSDAFTWQFDFMNSGTPGYLNVAQTLIGSGTSQNSPPSEVQIVDFYFASQKIWLTVTGTNNWLPSPWFTTNLMLPGSWTNVSAYERFALDTNTWTYTIRFPIPTNKPAYYYKVITTNAP